MRKKQLTNKQFWTLKQLTEAQRSRAVALGGQEAKMKISQFGNCHLVGPHRIWIIDRSGEIMFSGRPGKSPGGKI